MVVRFLERNATLYPTETALVELNPAISHRRTWKDASLIESDKNAPFRQHISWQVFNEKANRCANFLLNNGIKRGDKIAIILYNCLDWLPIYFGILKTGAIAVPFNFRYTADEILYCANLSQSLYYG